MTPEQRLALLDHGEQEAQLSEAARQERYRREDAQRAAERGAEDDASTRGKADRDKLRADIQALIEARENTPAKRDAQRIADLEDEVAKLTAAVAEMTTHKEEPPAP